MRRAPKVSLPGNETLEAKQPLLIDLPQPGVSSDINSKHWHSKALLHAKYCVIKEQVEQCSYPDCKVMKEVLNHLLVCSKDKSCKTAFCHSSRDILLHWMNCTELNCQVCCPTWQTTMTLKKCTQRQKSEAAFPTSETDPQPGTSSLPENNAAGASSSNFGDRGWRRLPWASLPKKRYNIHAIMIPDTDFNEILSMSISVNRERLDGEKDYFVQILTTIQASALDTLRHFVATQCYSSEVIAEQFNPFCVMSTIKEYDLKDRILGAESKMGMSIFQKQQALTLISYLCHVRERNHSKGSIENKCNHPNCTFMKIDFDHVVACRGKSCTKPDCPPTSRLLDHWESCFDKLCKVCYIANKTVC